MMYIVVKSGAIATNAAAIERLKAGEKVENVSDAGWVEVVAGDTVERGALRRGETVVCKLTDERIASLLDNGMLEAR